MKDEITQDQVDKFHRLAKEEWVKMRAEFKGSDVLFAMSSEALQFLGWYEQTKEDLSEKGFKVPVLDEKIQVTLS